MTTSDFFSGQDFYVPAYEVILGKKRLGDDFVRDVIQVEYTDNVEAIDTFNITINNWDAEKRSYKYTDLDVFHPGKDLELWMGYFERGKDKLRRMIAGKIYDWRPNFPASGQPTLMVKGQNVLHELRTEQQTHTYECKTDSQIATEIAGRFGIHNVDINPQDEKPYEHIFQDNEHDINFLIRRANLIGYDLYVDEENGTTLHFKPSTSAREVSFKFVYGKSLVSFQPSLATTNQVNEVSVQGWNAREKRNIQCVARRGDIITQGEPRFANAFQERREVTTSVPVESEDEAMRIATQTLERIAKQMITGNGTSIGVPELRAGSVITIEGLGELFSGRYFVNTTTHTINNSGYQTKFTCRKENG